MFVVDMLAVRFKVYLPDSFGVESWSSSYVVQDCQKPIEVDWLGVVSVIHLVDFVFVMSLFSLVDLCGSDPCSGCVRSQVNVVTVNWGTERGLSV